jgi:hypothetical protein
MNMRINRTTKIIGEKNKYSKENGRWKEWRKKEGNK